MLNGKSIPGTQIKFRLNWANYYSTFNKSIYVGNLNPDVDDISLYNLFKEKYSSVLHASVVTDKGKSKGFGFILFRGEKDYERCLHEMNGINFHGNKIRVSEQKKKEDDDKNSNSNNKDNYENYKHNLNNNNINEFNLNNNNIDINSLNNIINSRKLNKNNYNKATNSIGSNYFNNNDLEINTLFTENNIQNPKNNLFYSAVLNDTMTPSSKYILFTECNNESNYKINDYSRYIDSYAHTIYRKKVLPSSRVKTSEKNRFNTNKDIIFDYSHNNHQGRKIKNNETKELSYFNNLLL